MTNPTGMAPYDAAICGIETQTAIMARNTELLRRRAMGPDELDRAAYLILRALCTVDSTDVNGLATMLGLDASTAGRQLAGLANEDLVIRTPAAADHRRAVILITGEGRRRLELTITARRQRTADLLSDWTVQDLAQFGELLTRYNTAIADGYLTGPSWTEHPEPA